MSSPAGDVDGTASADALVSEKGKTVEQILEGKTIRQVRVDFGDLYLTMHDEFGSYDVRIGIEARYCDHAWLVLEGFDGTETVWRRELYD